MTVSRSYGALSRLAFVLCETDHCIIAARSGMGASLSFLNRDIFLSDRFFPLLGIIVETLFVLVILCSMFLIVFVWRVARDSTLYIVLLGLLLVAGERNVVKKNVVYLL